MLLRPLYFIVLLCILSCSKEARFVEGQSYDFNGTASYEFDAEIFTIEIPPAVLELTHRSRTNLKFMHSVTNSVGEVFVSYLTFDIDQRDSAIGAWLKPTNFSHDLSFEGEITKLDGQKGIVGTVSFTFIHEYLVDTGTSTYPASAPVSATGSFSIFPE